MKILLVKCEHCGSESFTNDWNSKSRMESFYYHCTNCGLIFDIFFNKNNFKLINSKDLVIWIENNQIVTWKPKRTPALGWNTLTVLEALTDSAKTYLALGNISQCQSQLNNLLKIMRNKIEHAKRQFKPLIQRCEYRETNRTRCNKTPIAGIKNGIHLCDYHFSKTMEKEQIITNWM